VKHTAYISHITATCFGYLDVAIARLYRLTKNEIYIKVMGEIAIEYCTY
jgi:hypothetical protein